MNTEQIIIADPELLYALKLQIKFMQEMGNYYEIDVITDRNFFDDYFSAPRDPACLIVNEEWITNAVSRQNIETIISLTNRAYKDDPTKIYRTSSTDEIFNRIRSMLRTGSDVSSPANRQAQVVMFFSPTGGSGKTTLAIGLAKYLASKYYRVLYVNTEAVQSFQYYFEDKQPIPSEITMKLIGASDNIYGMLKRTIKKDDISYLPPFSMPLFSYGIQEGIYTVFINEARDSKDFDFIIVDGDSSFNMEKSKQISAADKVFVVTKPNEASRYALRLFLSQVRANTGKFINVCNEAGDFPVSDMQDSSMVKISETVSTYRKEINADTISGFAMTPDVRKLAILVE